MHAPLSGWSACQRTCNSVTDYGAFVELEQGIEGRVHVSENDRQAHQESVKLVNVGDQVDW
jgi:ribosomal protein S1